MNNWLYTYTLEGKCYDADRTEYEMVLMSRWSDRKEKRIRTEMFLYCRNTAAN